jgi:hypothetical protein
MSDRPSRCAPIGVCDLRPVAQLQAAGDRSPAEDGGGSANSRGQRAADAAAVTDFGEQARGSRLWQIAARPDKAAA